MKPSLEGRLRILIEALDVAYRRCGEAAAAAEHSDAELNQQLLDMSYSINGMRHALDESMAEIDDFRHSQAPARNPEASADDYPQGADR